MASTWATSWLTSWASSWGAVDGGAVTPPRTGGIFGYERGARPKLRGLKRIYETIDAAVAKAKREQDEAKRLELEEAALSAKEAVTEAEFAPVFSPEFAILVSQMQVLADLRVARAKKVLEHLRALEAIEQDEDEAITLLLLH